MLLHEESSINSTQPLPHHHPANPRSLFFLPQPHAKRFSPSCHVLASWEQMAVLTEKTTIPQNASGKHEKHLILYRLEAIPGPRALIPLPQSQRAGKVRVLCRNNHFPHQTNTLTNKTHRPWCPRNLDAAPTPQRGGIGLSALEIRKTRTILMAGTCERIETCGPKEVPFSVPSSLCHHMINSFMEEENANHSITLIWTLNSIMLDLHCIT